ncbi:hypothetical protein Cylst_1811 [Cylindrospermum stagnale PCC 7417]|uniref:P pilus assembly/Cpx signaling pathway, periplasmic inhibitor/zinc-resistance associated protein n=1 Tax=Cylindrospermum stagnale PCC 7417 TaxID=56107 RepID=K9WUN7_9NOST|nr:hypothetical protein [Cylindrospermum stagnale]AFZ24070.1 hypothetical protein Cylst_1811 [Cylindrospermum stagnale PCC 7417]
MRFNKLSLLAGVVVLTLTATPFAVQAQTKVPSRQQGVEVPGQEALQSLGLTNTQKTQLQTIQRNTSSQITKILTPTQKAKLKTAIQSGQSQSQIFASLNLTDKQKAQIQQIFLSSRKQIQGILTVKQQQQIQQIEENSRLRRQQSNSQ